MVLQPLPGTWCPPGGAVWAAPCPETCQAQGVPWHHAACGPHTPTARFSRCLLLAGPQDLSLAVKQAASPNAWGRSHSRGWGEEHQKGPFRAKRPVQLSIHYPLASFLPRWGCLSSPVQPQEAHAARSSLPERIQLLCSRQDGSISPLLSAEPRQEAPPRAALPSRAARKAPTSRRGCPRS